jgi:hypothetical protein
MKSLFVLLLLIVVVSGKLAFRDARIVNSEESCSCPRNNKMLFLWEKLR